MRIRIKFSKNGNMRFVGHLDLLRFFQRALRRAEIDMAYTEGFSPHPILSFAMPLGLGLTSDGEYLDLELNSTQSSYEAMEALNSEMADGVRITGYVRLDDGAKKAMSAVAAADYIVYFRHREDFSRNEIADGVRSWYTGRDSIPVAKQTKKGERIVDLKPLLYRFEPYNDNSVSSGLLSGGISTVSPDHILSDSGVRKGFFLRLSAGSTDNIRPELALGDFYTFMGKDYDPFNMQIHRLELFETVTADHTPSEDHIMLMPLIAAGREILCHEE